MTIVRLTGQPKATAESYGDATLHDANLHEDLHRDDRLAARLFESELMDLYGAILIVVPLALLLKSLWS